MIGDFEDDTVRGARGGAPRETETEDEATVLGSRAQRGAQTTEPRPMLEEDSAGDTAIAVRPARASAQPLDDTVIAARGARDAVVPLERASVVGDAKGKTPPAAPSSREAYSPDASRLLETAAQTGPAPAMARRTPAAPAAAASEPVSGAAIERAIRARATRRMLALAVSAAAVFVGSLCLLIVLWQTWP